MPKPKRGRGIKSNSGWRGTCPLCKRTGVKLLWEKAVEGDKKTVCKQCGSN
ncbi:MAG: hypothetical protein FWC91_07945 [Defluviitaleaceae bacterium]|nr:hypothetical protein [Defluviitaleaceae bacterium]